MRRFLEELGVPEDSYRFEDGSGLSRRNEVAPETTMRVLLHMYNSPHRDLWIDSLPVGGVDGGLRLRFAGRRTLAHRIRAKTGTLSYVTALGGYAMTRSGVPQYAFSIVVNRHAAPSKEVRDLVDALALALAAPGAPSKQRTPRRRK